MSKYNVYFENIPRKQTETLLSRRTFINASLKAAGAATLMAIPGSNIAAGILGTVNEYSVQDVIDIILKAIPEALPSNTVDTIKAGSATQKVAGIVTTMFPTIEVIKEAVRINANFIQSNNYQIQLCLAQRDPSGNATNGITRDSSVLTTETMENDDIALKNINRWTPTCSLFAASSDPVREAARPVLRSERSRLCSGGSDRGRCSGPYNAPCRPCSHR